MEKNLNMIENYIYFYHLDQFCVLPVYPETVTDSMTSTFSETQALARSAPVFTYSYSGPRVVNITFNLHRDIMNDLNKGVSTFRDNVVPFQGSSLDYIDTLVKYLQSISLPKYDSSDKSVTPPMVALRLGNSVFIKGVVKDSVQVTYKKPIMSDGKYACVDITFSIAEFDPYDAISVSKVGSFRGLSAGNVANNNNNIYRE